MDLSGLLGLGFVVLFVLLILLFTLDARRRGTRAAALREIEAFQTLPTTVGQAVETGRRLHISLGSGSIGEMDTAAALAGLTVLDQVADAASVSDRPPVVTTADGTAMLLAQDTLRKVYRRQNALARYDPNSARVAGLSRFSFGAALTSLVKDEAVAGTILIGSVGLEAPLLTEAGRRAGVTTLAGSDDPAAQAMLFATADHPLIGEEMFAGGAYIGRLAAHIGSLRAQDLLRILVGAAILVGVLAKTLGLPLP
ncbi:MAG: DUF6754 domain-containing protein [Anaerolineales bacterium]